MNRLTRLTKIRPVCIALSSAVMMLSSISVAQTNGADTQIRLIARSAVSPILPNTFFLQREADFEPIVLIIQPLIGGETPLPLTGKISITGTGQVFAPSPEGCEIELTLAIRPIICTLRFNALGTGVISVDYSGSGVLRPSSSTLSIEVIDDPAMIDPTGDADGDGIPNAIERTLGKNALLKDNDVFNNTSLFVSQLYRDFLFREATDGDRLFWTDELQAGRYTNASLALAFINSPEFQERGGAVVRLGLAATGGLSLDVTSPDFQTLSSMLSSTTAEAFDSRLLRLANQLVQSPAFIAKYEALSNEVFVTAIYRDVLARTPSPAELEQWVRLITGGGLVPPGLSSFPALSRAAMLVMFSNSSEFRAKSTNQVAVSMAYLGFLRRQSEPAGYRYWFGELQRGMTQDQLVKAFIDSNEYRARLWLPLAIDPRVF
jgi:hypothetical protein